MALQPDQEAAAYADRMEDIEAKEEADKARAEAIVFGALIQCAADQWCEPQYIGRLWISPDELLCDTVNWHEDEATTNAYSAYMAGTGRRIDLMKAVAACIAYWMYEAILGD